MNFLRIAQFALLALFAQPSHCISLKSSTVIHERRDVNESWQRKSRAPSSVIVPVRVALTQRDIHLGHDRLIDISDPDSPRYGKHYTADEVTNMFAAPEDAARSVREWLVESGIGAARHYRSPFQIEFQATIEELEKLLKTEYHVYHHKELPNQPHQISCEEYSLPTQIQPHIDFIWPTIGHHPLRGSQLEKRGRLHPTTAQRFNLDPVNATEVMSSMGIHGNYSLSDCYRFIIPACIRALYDIPKGNISVPGNDLGIFEEDQYYDNKDLDLFFGNFTDVPQGTYPVQNSVDGGRGPVKNPRYAYGEPILDLDIATPLIYPQGIRLFQTDDGVEEADGIFDTFLDAIDASFCTYDGGDSNLDPKYPDPRKGGYKGKLECGKYKPPNVISLSYGLAENFFPLKYRQRQCYEYMKLALQGTTTVFSSGDSGVGSPTGCGPNGAFEPQFPASCPYVLAVGGTQIAKGNTVHDPEIAGANHLFNYHTGGGFSNQNAQPAYQKSAVSAYLKENPPPYSSSIFNASGRAYPDVSAVSVNILIYIEYALGRVPGTSASAPIWASILTLINGERVKAGKSTVGFVNPVLYKNPQAFHDITIGDNPGCNTTGFAAARGWDPVTGLGTPKYPELLTIFMSLP